MMRRLYGMARGAAAASSVLSLVAVNAIAANAAADAALAPGAFEVDVGYNPFDDRRTGEPSVAINPKDPNNLIIGLTASVHTLKNPEHTIQQYTSVPYNLLCGVGVSFDRGRTWKVSELRVPVGPIPTTRTPMPAGAVCFDTTTAAGPDGTFYAASVVSSPYDYGRAKSGHSKDQEFMGVFRSMDGGRTWTLLEGMGEGAGKPWITVDQSTGVLYAVNSGRRLTVSRDRGESFDPPLEKTWYYPEAAASGIASYDIMLSAAQGQLAVVYLSDRVPGESRQCPCAVFAVSGDEGKTFVRHPVPMSDGIGLLEYAPSLPHVTVAADPSRKGRFAVAFANKDDTELHVLVTNDSGASWSGPARLGHGGTPLNRVWINYSPTGVLAAMWRNNYASESILKAGLFRPAHLFSDIPPGPQDVFATISRKGNVNFTAPVKVNADRSPEPPQGGMTGELVGIDDYSSLVVDREAVHVSWGDYRGIDRSVWYGQVPLSVFSGSAPPPGKREAKKAQTDAPSFEE